MSLIFQENVNDMLIKITQELTNNVIFFIVAKILYASIDSPESLDLISCSALFHFLLDIFILRNFYILLM